MFGLKSIPVSVAGRWNRFISELLPLIFCLPLVGCDSSDDKVGTIIEPVETAPRKALLEEDFIGSRELAQTENKLRKPLPITLKDTENLEELRQKYPDNDRIFNCLLQIYDQQRNWNAMALMLEAFPGADQNPVYADLYGTTLTKIGRYAEAEKVFANLSETQPARDSYALSHALCLYHMGQLEKAALRLDQLIKVANEEFKVKSLSLRGMVAVQQQDFDTAIDVFQKTLELDMNEIVALQSMSRLMHLLGKPEEAAKFEERAQAIRNDGNRKTGDVILGGTLIGAVRRAMLRKDYDEAKRMIDKLMPISSEGLRRELDSHLFIINEEEADGNSKNTDDDPADQLN